MIYFLDCDFFKSNSVRMKTLSFHKSVEVGSDDVTGQNTLWYKSLNCYFICWTVSNVFTSHCPTAEYVYLFVNYCPIYRFPRLVLKHQELVTWSLWPMEPSPLAHWMEPMLRWGKKLVKRTSSFLAWQLKKYRSSREMGKTIFYKTYIA